LTVFASKYGLNGFYVISYTLIFSQTSKRMYMCIISDLDIQQYYQDISFKFTF